MAGPLNKDGKRYADRSKSSVLSHLLDENADNYRRQLEGKGIKPKNHHKQNLKHIEAVQKSAKQQQQQREVENKANKPKNRKYANIDSKVKQTLKAKQSQSPPTSTAAKSTNFIMRNRSQIQSQSALNTSAAKRDRINPARKPAIPKRSELNISKAPVNKGKEEKDFVALNKTRTQEMLKKSKSRLDKENKQRFVKKKDYGKVPDYLRKYKLEREELEHKKMEEEEARKIPDGMRQMSEQERCETLAILEENKRKIVDSIKHLPLVVETPSMIKYQRELNEKLKQVEQTIDLFQKPTVFVALEQ